MFTRQLSKIICGDRRRICERLVEQCSHFRKQIHNLRGYMELMMLCIKLLCQLPGIHGFIELLVPEHHGKCVQSLRSFFIGSRQHASRIHTRSEEHTSELQSHSFISYAV